MDLDKVRREEDLPDSTSDSAVVLCSFNQHYKVSPASNLRAYARTLDSRVPWHLGHRGVG
eukprot:956378-Prorocentrum_minimum.AAC.3